MRLQVDAEYQALLCYRMATIADTMWSQNDLESAYEELRHRASGDEKLRHGWWAPSGSFAWLHRWNVEIDPARILGRYFELESKCSWQFYYNRPAVDAVLSCPNGETKNIEFTVAFEDQSAGQEPEKAGYQERLRMEKVINDGHAGAYTPLVRDKSTGRIEQSARSMRCGRDVVGNWSRGVASALKKKGYLHRRQSYGEGSSLCVYAYGLSGDPFFNGEPSALDKIVNRLSPEALSNGFERTFLMGWHTNWFRAV